VGFREDALAVTPGDHKRLADTLEAVADDDVQATLRRRGT
jgi:hypothetical protein